LYCSILEEQKKLVACWKKWRKQAQNKGKYFKANSTNKGIKDPLKKEILIAARKSLRCY
jgi:hypothetical protein